ncbi:MAG: hypothetical protein ACKOD9_18910 [Rubrivivax sp.]
MAANLRGAKTCTLMLAAVPVAQVGALPAGNTLVVSDIPQVGGFSQITGIACVKPEPDQARFTGQETGYVGRIQCNSACCIIFGR